MIKVKQLKLRIFAQFVIIIAPITLVLIYQAVSDQRRTAAVESVVVRHGLSRATKEGFESFMTHAADAVDMGDEPNPARVVLVSRVVQSLLFRHLYPRSVCSRGCRMYTKKGPLPIWRGPLRFSSATCYESVLLPAQNLSIALLVSEAG